MLTDEDPLQVVKKTKRGRKLTRDKPPKLLPRFRKSKDTYKYSYHAPSEEWIKHGVQHDHDYIDKPVVRLWTALQDHTYYRVHDLSCQVCGCKCENQRILTIHSNSHLEKNVTWFKCSYCEFRAGLYRDVVNHICQEKQNVKVIGQILRCEKCPFQCRSLRKLVKHKSIKHPMERLPPTWYKCSFCKFRSRARNDVVHHVCNGKLFSNVVLKDMAKCNICNFKCRTLRQLARHKNTVHSKCPREEILGI